MKGARAPGRWFIEASPAPCAGAVMLNPSTIRIKAVALQLSYTTVQSVRTKLGAQVQGSSTIWAHTSGLCQNLKHPADHVRLPQATEKEYPTVTTLYSTDAYPRVQTGQVRRPGRPGGDSDGTAQRKRGRVIDAVPAVVLSETFLARPSWIPEIRDFVRRCLAESPLNEEAPAGSVRPCPRLLDAAGPTGAIQVSFRIFPEHVEVDVPHSNQPPGEMASPAEVGGRAPAVAARTPVAGARAGATPRRPRSPTGCPPRCAARG